MIPRHDGPWRPLSESIAACEAHRDFLYDDYLRAVADGREPTVDEAAERKRRDCEGRTVARMRVRSAVQRAARNIVAAEYQRWLNEQAAA